VRRRILSVFLLLLFSLGLTVPAALALSAPDESSSADSKLPPCCRKDGKHRCGMASSSAAAAKSPGVRMASAKCAECPRNGSQAPVSFAQQFCLDAAATGEFPVLSAGSATAGGAEAPLFVTRLAWRVSSKRGPPSHLSRS
jgi:hypothetical protein